ncbi:hypothetical protein LXL04_020651 [Taraxacum kok-saghyz]
MRKGRSILCIVKEGKEDPWRTDILPLLIFKEIPNRKLIKAIDEYEGEDPLQPWFACIKWVQDAFPPGGDCSGLVVILEQCVRTFWHEEQYKNDIRYLKVWLEYAGYCDDAEVVYGFLNTNKIGEMHAIFYISYATHLESKNKIKTGNNIYECGIARNAQPIEKLKSAYRKFFTRSMSRPKAIEEESMDTCQPTRSFGTILTKADSGNRPLDSCEIARKRQKQEGELHIMDGCFFLTQITTIGSSPGFEDGEFESSKIMRPASLLYHDDDDCLYFVDSENHAIRRADMESSISSKGFMHFTY